MLHLQAWMKPNNWFYFKMEWRNNGGVSFNSRSTIQPPINGAISVVESTSWRGIVGDNLNWHSHRALWKFYLSTWVYNPNALNTCIIYSLWWRSFAHSSTKENCTIIILYNNLHSYLNEPWRQKKQPFKWTLLPIQPNPIQTKPTQPNAMQCSAILPKSRERVEWEKKKMRSIVNN